VAALEAQHKVLEAQRLRQRTRFDLEMLQEIGYCSGIENYSRHMDGRAAGTRPYCLLDYFPDDLLVVIDESHATVPQVRAMFNGDRNRKQTLVDHGFRLPSALDNRPLRFEEFVEICPQTLFLSATPGDYELERCGGQAVEQLLRPTGLLDPAIEVRPSKGQVEDLVEEIRVRTARDERVLVTTLTKRMAEDLTSYMARMGIRVRYLHSDIESLRRVEILRSLRLGEFDVLVGINLLREGLDLPEVGLVAVLDADKEGFLRSARSLFQIVGRAARNVDGQVLFYADRISDAMAQVLEVTARRREVQAEYNRENGITPRTVRKSSSEVMASTTVLDEARQLEAWSRSESKATRVAEGLAPWEQDAEDPELLRSLMESAAAALDFERAAELRDRLLAVEGHPDPGAFRPQSESREQLKSRNRRQAGDAVKRMKRMRPPPG
jgi:excinuclease ABC subunit B